MAPGRWRASPQTPATVSGRPLGLGVGEVQSGQRGPLALVLDPEGVTTEVDRFNQGGTDVGHGVEYEVNPDRCR
jgi:hypothetical protein